MRFILVLSSLFLTNCGIDATLTSGSEATSLPPVTPFSVQLTSAAVSPHNSSAISVTVDFGSMAVTGLSAADFVVVNGTATNLVDLGSATKFTVDLNPSGSGTFTSSITLPQDSIKNADGDNNLASNTLNFTIDTSGPTIVISGPSPASGSASTSFVYTVTYTDAATVNLTNGSLAFGGTGAAGCSAVVTNGTTTTPTVTVSGCSGDGTMNFSIIANTAQDTVGNQAASYGPSSSATVKNSFILSIDTRKPGSANDTFELPLTYWSGYNFKVEWGDGSSQTVSSATWNPSNGAISHQYATAGVYTVKFKGALPAFQFYASGDALKVLDVKQWGTIVWDTMELMFAGCENMQMTATDAPDLSSVTNMIGVFQAASVFNGAIGQWDTSHVTDMTGMFIGAKAFNQPIGGWNVSNVTSMNSMFDSAEVFNQDISAWNTSKVTSMARMFAGTKAFNQPLAKSGSSWDTSKVTSMVGMFQSAEAFNQDISSWVFGAGLTDMHQMFLNAPVFNQNLSPWVLPAGVDHSLYDSGAVSWVLGRPTFP